MSTDYFTRAEYRAFAGDTTSTDAQIDAAQTEVIDALEEWAGSAWPHVTGVAGDGTAAGARSTTEFFDGPTDLLVTSKLPVIAITSIENAGVVVAAESYYLYLEDGRIRFPSEIGLAPRVLEVAYTYGHTTTPWTIKRPAMQATKALLRQQSGRSKIPQRASQLQSEGTTILLNTEDDDKRPWPWEEDASRDVRSYWGPSRPIIAGAV